LLTHFDERQLMDLVFLVGHYSSIAMALNSFGIQIEGRQASGTRT
jgi:alkylhydroperoxidase family enzyme